MDAPRTMAFIPSDGDANGRFPLETAFCSCFWTLFLEDYIRWTKESIEWTACWLVAMGADEFVDVFGED